MSETTPTKERLARELEMSGYPDLAKRAREGEFDDYESRHATPQIILHQELVQRGNSTFAERVRAGEFDATAEEAHAWATSPEGRETIAEMENVLVTPNVAGLIGMLGGAFLTVSAIHPKDLERGHAFALGLKRVLDLWLERVKELGH